MMMVAIGSCSDELWHVNEIGSQLTEDDDYRLSTFQLSDDVWDIPESVLYFHIVLKSHTDDSELRFEALCKHLYGQTQVTIKIPKGLTIPDSDYDLRGYLEDGKSLNRCIAVTFRNEMLHAFLNSAVNYEYSLDGEGTISNPYLIKDDEDFDTFMFELGEDTETHGANYYFKQTADIETTSADEVSQGRYHRGEKFAGNYDGDGHKLTVTFTGAAKQEQDDYVGMFTQLLDGASVKNLTLNAEISGIRSKGGTLAGTASGKVTVSNVNVLGSIMLSKTEVGGLIGAVSGTLNASNLELRCSVLGTEKVGGIVGNALQATLNISNVTNFENGKARKFMVNGSVGKVGGLVGQAENCTVNIKQVKLQWAVQASEKEIGVIYGKQGIGGLIGEALINGSSTLAQCNVTATVTGYEDYVGGLVGKMVLNEKLTAIDNEVHAPISGRIYVGGFFGYLSSKGKLEFTSSDGNACNKIGQTNSNDVGVVGLECAGGMFGFLEGNFTSKGVHKINVNVWAKRFKGGGIVGLLKGSTLDAAHFKLENTMTVSGHESIGGLVGQAEESTISGGMKNITFDNKIPSKSTFSSNFPGSVQCDSTGKGTYMGGIVGLARTTKLNHLCCTGTVNGTSKVGGIVGYLDNKEGGTMSHLVSAMSNINVDGNEVGGIAGHIETILAHYSYLLNYTNVKGKNPTGGIIGKLIVHSRYYTFSLEYGVNVGTINGTVNVGGVMGYLGYDSGAYDGKEMNVMYCANYGSITNSANGNVGGIIGHGDRTHMRVLFSANHGAVNSTSQSSKVGGIIGRIGHDSGLFWMGKNIELAYCCNRGTIHADHKDSHVGGLAGYQEEGDSRDDFQWRTHDCYNAGAVTAEMKADCGGVLGCIDHYGHISRCINIGQVKKGNGVLGTHHGTKYYTSDLYYLDGSAPKNWKCTKFSDNNKKKKDTFKNFDFDNIWVIAANDSEAENKGFPYLKPQKCPFQFITYSQP